MRAVGQASLGLEVTRLEIHCSGCGGWAAALGSWVALVLVELAVAAYSRAPSSSSAAPIHRGFVNRRNQYLLYIYYTYVCTYINTYMQIIFLSNHHIDNYNEGLKIPKKTAERF